MRDEFSRSLPSLAFLLSNKSDSGHGIGESADARCSLAGGCVLRRVCLFEFESWLESCNESSIAKWE